MSGRPWSALELALLRKGYPDTTTSELALSIGRPIGQVYQAANRIGLRKSAAYMEREFEHRRERNSTNHAFKSCQFKPGLVPWSAGTKGVVGVHPACRAVQFKPGQMNGHAAQIVAAVGSTRINTDGLLDRKINDAPGPQNLRWRGVHRLLWEATYGPVPAGNAVVFKPGRKSIIEAEITLDAIECISRRELMSRNSLHNFPKELAELIQLRGVLNRQINARTKSDERL